MRTKLFATLLVLVAAALASATGHATSPEHPTPSIHSPELPLSRSPAPDAAVPLALDWQQTIPSQAPDGRLSEVTTWSHGFATLGEDGAGMPTVWVSPDGASWTSRSLPFLKQLQPQLGALDGRLVVVAGVPHGGTEHLASWTSRDGERWRRAPDGPAMAAPERSLPGYLAITRPVQVGGRLVVYGDWLGCCGSVTPQIAGQPGRSYAFLSAAATRNGIVAWRSRDGLHWTRRPITRTLDSLDCVTEDREQLIGLDYGSPLVASADGVHWEPVGEVPIDRGPPDAACVWTTVTGYLQVGVVQGDTVRGYHGSTGISASADGRSWSPVQTLLGFEVGGVAVLDDTVVLDGLRSGPDLAEPIPAQLLSTDAGRTWSPTSDWPSTTIASDGRVIVAVGDGAWVATTDGS